MEIVVFGMGYVGLSNAVLLAQKHHVVAIDILEEKVNQLNKRMSPIHDKEIETFLTQKSVNIRGALRWEGPVEKADLVIIATPTDYCESKHSFDTSTVEKVLSDVRSVNSEVLIVIKSTIPMGFMQRLNQAGYRNVIFMPEFLREGRALFDNLYPSRIVVGDKGLAGQKIAEIYLSCSKNQSTPVLLVEPSEAEAIKLFANSYLALRVAFFNELDSFALARGLDAETVIKGVGLDPRIGTHYCNPSFGYGGYCLPKDTKALCNEFEDIPCAIIPAIVESNRLRKQFIAEHIVTKGIKTIGIYRLTMKAGSDNFRSAAVIDIIELLRKLNLEVILFEPRLKNHDRYLNCEVINDFFEFSRRSEVILANRWSSKLSEIRHKVFSRDIYESRIEE